jgi:hypothetical protein
MEIKSQNNPKKSRVHFLFLLKPQSQDPNWDLTHSTQGPMWPPDHSHQRQPININGYLLLIQTKEPPNNAHYLLSSLFIASSSTPVSLSIIRAK